jgi:hypothetical protein
MNTTHTSLSLFTRDLESTFHGTAGRRLLSELESLGLLTGEYQKPIDFATALQESSDQTDQSLFALVDLAHNDARLTSVIMVALASELTHAINRSGAKWLTQERYGDLYLGARDALAQPATTRTMLARQIISRTRALSRADEASRVASVSWTADMDIAAIEEEVDPRLELLELALTRHVISAPDFDLIVRTRTQGSTLAHAAASMDISYDAARQRRARSEAKLKTFVLRELNR